MRAKIAAAAWMLALVTGGAQAQVTLTLSNWLAPMHPLRTQALDVWVKNVEQATEGRVKIRTLPKVIGAPGAQIEVVGQGLADIALIAHGYVPGRFVLQSMAELPLLGDLGVDVSPAYWRIYDKHFRKVDEHKGVVVLSVMTGSAGQIHNRKTEVRSVDHFNGLKIRVPGGATTEAMKLLGAVPILKPVNEAYELISTGVVDGTLFSQLSLSANKLTPLLKHTTNIPGGIYNASYALFINPEKWQSISEADRARIMAESGEKFALMWGKVFDDGDAKAVEEARAMGNKVQAASSQLVSDLKTRLAPIEAEWVQAARSKGLTDSDKVLSEFRALIASRPAKPD